MSKLIIVFLVAAFGPMSDCKAGEPADQRLRFLASRLDAPIEELDKGDSSLPLFVETTAALASLPGSDKDPEKRVTIWINEDAFRKRTAGEFDSEKTSIRLREKLIKQPLSKILEVICAQIDAGYLVRKDHIEILPVQDVLSELNYPDGSDRDVRNLVVRFFDGIPLSEAFNSLAEKHGRTVLLSPRAESVLGQKFKLRLVNVPFDVAVEALADVAGLKVVRKANVFFVTTSENAASLNNEPDSKPKSDNPRKEPIKK